MAAGLTLWSAAECDGGSLRGIGTGPGDDLWNTPLFSRERCF